MRIPVHPVTSEHKEYCARPSSGFGLGRRCSNFANRLESRAEANRNYHQFAVIGIQLWNVCVCVCVRNPVLGAQDNALAKCRAHTSMHLCVRESLCVCVCHMLALLPNCSESARLSTNCGSAVLARQ